MSEYCIPIPTLSLGACHVLLLRGSRLFLLQFPATDGRTQEAQTKSVEAVPNLGIVV